MIASRDLLIALEALDRQTGRSELQQTHAELSAAALPQIARLRAKLDGLQSHQSAEIELIVRDLLEADTTWVEKWIGALTQAVCNDPLAVLPLVNFGSTGRAGAQLMAHPLVRLSLTVLPHEQLLARKQAEGPRSIVFPGTVSVQRFIRAGDAVLSLWQAPRADDEFTIDGPARCRIVGERRLKDGATLRMDGRYETYSISQASGPILVIQAEIFAGRAALLVEYDPDAHIPIAASSTDDGSSRTQMLLTFLRTRARACDYAILARFAEDERFFVRWHAVREWLLVDPTGAMPQLRRMSRADPHPDIRETASEIIFHLDNATAKGEAPCHV
ncbi:hypothetical protein [Alteriqipengyuania sp. 357]